MHLLFLEVHVRQTRKGGNALEICQKTSVNWEVQEAERQAPPARLGGRGRELHRSTRAQPTARAPGQSPRPSSSASPASASHAGDTGNFPSSRSLLLAREKTVRRCFVCFRCIDASTNGPWTLDAALQKLLQSTPNASRVDMLPIPHWSVRVFSTSGQDEKCFFSLKASNIFSRGR